MYFICYNEYFTDKIKDALVQEYFSIQTNTII